MREPSALAARARKTLASIAQLLFFWIGGSLGLASDASADLIIGTAASLRVPMLEIAELFETTATGMEAVVSFGASSALAQQIRAGAPIDVFCSADPEIAAALTEEGLLVAGRTVTIAGNRLVVVRAANLDFALERPSDLMRPELRRIALPEFAVPVGRYAREWLRARGLLERLKTRTVQTDHALATLRAVDAGLADAAILYATDARLAKTARVAFEIPESEQPTITYVASPVTGARNFEAASRFVEFLRAPPSVREFARAGFPPTTQSAGAK